MYKEELFEACDNGDFQTVKKYFKKIFSSSSKTLNTSQEIGFNALFKAVWSGHTKIVKFLLNQGASITSKDKNIRPLLLVAVNKGHYDIVKLLVDSGADVNALRLTPIFGPLTKVESAS
ncbi:MAG: ankyrin repeat domain-containing protein [Desulfobacter sp.]|nr:ankyrin repeat domain-containing protein [Desulfobacter sp.]